MITAGIDIGTNTALMVVAEHRADGSMTVIDDVQELPRLGEGLSQTGHIREASIARAILSMERFRDVLAHYPHARVRAVATSAIREAANGRDVASLLSGALGHPIEVIDGAEEARLTFLGSVGTSAVPTLMIDIGGGSTEYAVGVNGIVTFSTSIPFGAVKFTERFAIERPVPQDAISEAMAVVASSLAPYREHFIHAEQCVGVAGTPVALAMMDAGLSSYREELIDGYILSRDRIDTLANLLVSMSLEDVRCIPGIHERRADIVPMGACILTESMRVLGCTEMTVVTRGLRYGAMLST